MNQKLAKQNYDFCEATVDMKSSLEVSYLDLAQRLYKIREEKMYEPNYDTFEEFLEEMKMSLATASKIINVWFRFIVGFKIAPKVIAKAGGWSKAAEILPYAQNKADAVSWLHKSELMSQSDLRKELKEAETGIFMGECQHEDKKTITFTKCGSCGFTERVNV